jgi:hypothetical protein
MGISSLWYNWGWAAQGGSWSVRVSFDPRHGFAQTSISISLNDGMGYNGIGITHFETRPEPNGPNVPFDFGFNGNFGYPPAIHADQLTEVIAEIGTSDNNGQVVGLLTVFLFD